MKKFLACLLFLLVMAGLASCGNVEYETPQDVLVLEDDAPYYPQQQDFPIEHLEAIAYPPEEDEPGEIGNFDHIVELFVSYTDPPFRTDA